MAPAKPPVSGDSALESAILSVIKARARERMTPFAIAKELDKAYSVSGEEYEGDDGRLPAIVVYQRAEDRGGILAVTRLLDNLAVKLPNNVVYDSELQTYYWQQ